MNELALIGAGSIASLAATLLLGAASYKKFQNANLLDYPYHPSEVIGIFQDREKLRRNGNFKSNRTKTEVSGYACIRGNAFSTKPIRSILTKETPFVYLLEYRDEVYAHERVYRRNNRMPNRIVRRNAHFAPEVYLKDRQGSIEVSLVLNPEKTHVELVPGDRSFFSEKLNSNPPRIARLKEGLLYALDVLTLGIFMIKGAQVGYRDCQIGFQVGSPLMAFGEIVYDVSKKSLEMKTVKAIGKDLINYINDERAKAIALGVLSVYALVAFFATGAAFLDRWAWLKGNQAQLVRDEPTDNLAMQCVICWVNRRTIILEPCYHAVLCATCSKQYKKTVCPICNKMITKRRELSYG